MKIFIAITLILFSFNLFASTKLEGLCKHRNGDLVDCQDFNICDYGMSGLHDFIQSQCVANQDQCKTKNGIVACQDSVICGQIVEDGYYRGRCALRMVVPKPPQYKPCDKNVDPVCICRYGMSGVNDYQRGKCDVTPKMCKTNFGFYPCKDYDICSDNDFMAYVDGDCAVRLVNRSL